VQSVSFDDGEAPSPDVRFEQPRKSGVPPLSSFVLFNVSVLPVGPFCLSPDFFGLLPLVFKYRPVLSLRLLSPFSLICFFFFSRSSFSFFSLALLPAQFKN